MDKIDFQEYLNRWKLVDEIEAWEIRNASFELMVKQTFSIWDIGRSLGFSTRTELPGPLWPKLQRKWMERLA